MRRATAFVICALAFAIGCVLAPLAVAAMLLVDTIAEHRS